MVTAIEPLIREQLIPTAATSLRSFQTVSRREHRTDPPPARSRFSPAKDGHYFTELFELLSRPPTGRLIANPLTRLCIDHLLSLEARALEDDLALAASIQKGLLPQRFQKIDGWEIAYHYQPAGIVSGDYCDLISSDDQRVCCLCLAMYQARELLRQC